MIGLGIAYAVHCLLHAQLFASHLDTNLNVVSASLRFLWLIWTKNEINSIFRRGMIVGKCKFS